MNRNQKIAMAEADLSIKALGFKLDLSSNYVSGVFAGRYPAPGVRVKIAKVLGKPVSFLWPKEGNPQR